MTELQNSSQKVTGEMMDADTEYAKCQDLLRQDKIEEAIDSLERIVFKDPDYAIAFNDLGVLYYRVGENNRCLDCYERAVCIAPDNANFRKNLADYYLVEQGRVEEALEIYLSVLKDNPEDIEVLLAAGHVCVGIGQKGSARVFYERVLDIEPWNFDAAEKLEHLGKKKEISNNIKSL